MEVVLTVGQCRNAARLVCRAEHGLTAVRQLRGERMMGFFRPSPGLTVLLYLAAMQGRVVWQWPTGFAVLEPPNTDSDWWPPGRRARWARGAEFVWPMLRDFVPVIVLLVMFLPIALFAGPYAFLMATLDGLAIMLYILAIYLAAGFRALRWFVRWLAGRESGRQAAVDRVLSRNWSVGLCHLADPATADAQLRECLLQATALAAGTRHAGAVLVCRNTAVTTEAGRAAVAAAAVALAVPDTGEAMVVVRTPGDAAPTPVPPSLPSGALAAVMVFVLCLVGLAAQASSIVDMGHPAEYGDVLLWLLDEAWLFGDFGTTAPTWPLARVNGVIAQLAGLAATGFLVRAVWLAYRGRQAAGNVGEQAVKREIARADAGLVFLNYRSGEHKPLVKALRRELASQLGQDKVFMDYWSMKPGVRYPDALRAGVQRCRALLVIIHDGWLEALRTPRDGPDWVHDEIAMALELGKVVIGVYFDGAPRLFMEDLPPDIRELALRQDCRIGWRDGNLDDDLDRLVREVLTAVRQREGARIEPGPAGRPGVTEEST
jgi:TIR domain